MKRWLCALLCLCLFLFAPGARGESDDPDESTLRLEDAVIPTPKPLTTQEPPEQIYAVSDVAEGGEETQIQEGERPKFVQQLMDIARGELGYTEGDNNHSKYGEWSGDPCAAWCAEFVCWCVDQVDQQYGTELLNTVYPNYSGQNTGRDWFIQRGRFVYRKGNCPGWGYQWLKGADHLMKRNEYIPRSGDLVFFSYNEAGDTEHVALVEYCATDPQGNVLVHVIEGNNPSSVQRNAYRLDNSQILGYGACEDVVDTTIRMGNRGDRVLLLQQMLNQLGLLEERHLTGGFGGNTKAAILRFQQEWMVGKTPNGVADRETTQAIQTEIERMTFEDPDSWLVTE